MSEPPAANLDGTGILDQAAFRQVVTLHRYPAGDVLDGLVVWFWAVRWTLPAGRHHVQRLLPRPGANVAVGPRSGDSVDGHGVIAGTVSGLTRRTSTRRLTGHGWTIGALTTPGGLGAWLDRPAVQLTGTEAPLAVLGDDGTTLVDAIAGPPPAPGCLPAPEDDDERRRVDLLRAWLEERTRRAAPERVAAARNVARIAALADADRSLRRVEDLAAAAGIGTRTLQRAFAEHLGASPKWYLRRLRLLEAARAAQDGNPVSWSELAAALGYSDQAHLVRDFRAHVGESPAAYARRQGPSPGVTR